MAADRMPRRLAAILAADIAGYSRLTGADEEGTVARLRALRAELIDPAIAAHDGRIVKTAGDGMLIEFASVVDAVRAALAVQTAMRARNAPLAPDTRLLFRVGIHLGDVLVQPDGDLLGDGVNIAARLEGIAVPGGICLSRAAHEQVEGKVDAMFADLGEQSLKNIARPVHVFAIQNDAPSRRKPGPIVNEDSPRRTVDPDFRRGGAIEGNADQKIEGAPRLSIVVLPFANIGGDAEQEYFVDGLTEDLTTELSRIPGAFVIARNTAFTYKGKPVDVKQIGRDLNVRYVLEGSIRRGGNRVRVNAQLIDAETGAHLWADRFDRDLVDLFELQDAVTAELASVLNAKMIEVEGRKSARVADPTVIDLVMQARATAARGISRENYAVASALYEQALARDPNDPMALGGLAGLHAAKVTSLITDDRTRDIEQAIALASKALTIDPNHLGAHFALGVAFRGAGRFDEAKLHQETVLRLNPSSRAAHGELGWIKQFLGDFDGSLPHFEKAIRLGPRDLGVYIDLLGIGIVFRRRGEIGRAIEYYRKSYDLFPQWSWSRLMLAADYGQTSRMVDARHFLDLYLSGNPAAKTISELRRQIPSSNPEYMLGRESMYEGLRKAGMAEE